MINRRGWAVLAMVFMTGLTGPARAETLADALTYAYENSGLLAQNRALLRAADEDVVQGLASLRPVISWSASATRSSPLPAGSDLVQSNARISGELMLYDFGAGRLAVDAQKELVLGTRQTLRGVEQDMLLRVVQAYMNVRSDIEFVALRQNNVRLITQEFRAANDRFEVGEVTRTDVALAEARLASARSLLAAAQGNLARSNEEFRAAVGRTPGSLRTVSPAPISLSISDAKSFAAQNHPSVLEVQHSVSAAELNIRRAEAVIKPSVTLNGFVGVDQDLNDSAQIGVTIGGPIYNGGRMSSQVRQFRASRDAARAGLHITTVSIEQQVGNAYSFLRVARASRQASDQQISAAEVAFRGVREEATLGARTTLDVLNAEQELLDARAARISAQAEEVVASYAVLASLGLLTAEHLKLPVQIYDPAAYYNMAKDAPTATSPQGRALDRVLQAIGD